jgi:hypothetical protein
MEKTLASGQVVIHNGQVITQPDQLPSEAAIAGDDPDARAAVETNIRERMDGLQRQMDELRARPVTEQPKTQTAATAPTTITAPTTAPAPAHAPAADEGGAKPKGR